MTSHLPIVALMGLLAAAEPPADEVTPSTADPTTVATRTLRSPRTHQMASEDTPLPLTDAAADPQSLDVTLVAGAWLPRFGGESSLGAGARISNEREFNIDKTSATPNFELTIRNGDEFDLTLSGFHFDARSNEVFPNTATWGGVLLDPGDSINVRFTLTSVGVEIGWNQSRPFTETPEIREHYDNYTTTGEPRADLRFTPLFGVRYITAKQVVNNLTDATAGTGEGDWLALYAGFQFTFDVRPELPLSALWRLQGAAALGPAIGGDGGLLFMVRAGLSIHPIENFGVQFGYRLFELDLENDGFELNGGLQGLFIAGSIRF